MRISAHAREGIADGAKENTACTLTRGGLSSSLLSASTSFFNITSQTATFLVLDDKSCCVDLRVANAAIATVRRIEWEGSSSLHHYLIPSARGDARGVRLWVAGLSSTMHYLLPVVACFKLRTRLLLLLLSAVSNVWCLPRHIETRHDTNPGVFYRTRFYPKWTSILISEKAPPF